MDDVIMMMLLRGEHVSMELRLDRGAWPHDPLRLEDLVARIVQALEHERLFPRVWQPARPRETVHEGGTIERLAADRYIYRAQRHHPVNPAVVGDSIERVFPSAEAAARHYLRWALNLPGKLDGYAVIA
jgi:hypothetical protein